MPRAKKKQEELNLRNASFEIVQHKLCMTCKHWWNYRTAIDGICQPRHLQYRDENDHFKQTPANGTCDIWQEKGGAE